MSALNRSFNLLRAAGRQQILPRANLSSKPAKHTLSLGEQLFGLSAMFLAIMGPSGWILSHLDYYKNPTGAVLDD